LDSVVPLQLLEGYAPGDCDRLRRRTHGTGNKTEPAWFAEFVRGLARQFGRTPVQPRGVVLQSIFGQHQRRAAERVRLNHVRAGREIATVHIQHDVGPGPHQVLIASLERVAAEIRRPQIRPLQHCAHRAVENDDP
jgi:hypothetical protein